MQLKTEFYAANKLIMPKILRIVGKHDTSFISMEGNLQKCLNSNEISLIVNTKKGPVRDCVNKKIRFQNCK